MKERTQGNRSYLVLISDLARSVAVRANEGFAKDKLHRELDLFVKLKEGHGRVNFVLAKVLLSIRDVTLEEISLRRQRVSGLRGLGLG